MELSERQLAELVRFNLDDAISVDDPGALDAFHAGKRIFDTSYKAKKLDSFVVAHHLRHCIDYSRKLPPGDWPYPFERFWDQPVYLIARADPALAAAPLPDGRR